MPKHDEQDEEEHENEKTSAPVKAPAKGRGAAAKNKKTDDDEQKDAGKARATIDTWAKSFLPAETGEDDELENEAESPNKKAKGKVGRKPAPKTKATAHENEPENGRYSESRAKWLDRNNFLSL